MPVSRFFTLRTLDAAVAGSNGGGGGVVDPGSPAAPVLAPDPLHTRRRGADLTGAARGGDQRGDPEAQDWLHL